MFLCTECEKRTEAFYYDTNNFLEIFPFGIGSSAWLSAWRLPWYHPFHLVSYISFLSNIILVPLGYISIFRFRQLQNERSVGLSERASNSRKRRNLVNLKFNLFTWILETASVLVVIVDRGDNFKIFYILCVSCGPPLLYFMGIEENRRAAKEYIKSNIRVFNKIAKENGNDDEISVPECELYKGLSKYHYGLIT